MTKVGELRVWWKDNRGSKIVPVSSVADAVKFCADKALAQLTDPGITFNAFGLEEFDGADWFEWHSEEGDDIGALVDEANGWD